MGGTAARGDRRRRVLQEEIIAMSREQAAYTAQPEEKAGLARRFALEEGTLGHALATRLFPRSHWITAALLSALVLILGGVVAADQLLATRLVATPLRELLTIDHPQSLGRWLNGTMWTCLACECALVLTVRRRQADDFRGRYRRWRTIALGCVATSAITATQLHHTVAVLIAQATGWSLLADGAIWWLTPTLLLLGWLGVRLVSEVRESRVAATLLSLSLVGMTTHALLAAGVISSQMWPQVEVAAHISGWAGLSLALTSILAYMRHIAQQVASNATVRPLRVVSEPKAKAKPTKAAEAPAKDPAPAPVKAKPAVVESEPTPPAAKKADVNVWVESEDDEDESAADRRLSKADRKRQRREQRRAA